VPKSKWAAQGADLGGKHGGFVQAARRKYMFVGETSRTPLAAFRLRAVDVAESSGIGDTLAKVIRAATAGKVKPCEGCDKRRKALNRMIPYRRKCEDCGKAKQTDD
jgi:hypothetical protein